jgi:hypothetical protein
MKLREPEPLPHLRDCRAEPLPLARSHPRTILPRWGRRFFAFVDKTLARRDAPLSLLCALLLGLVFVVIPTVFALWIWRGDYRVET